MNDTPTSNELLAASRLIGADVMFLQLVEYVAVKATGAARVSDPDARARIDELQAEFRRACAAIFAKHVGAERARASLAALESAPVQRYLVARQTMAPLFAQQLGALRERMGKIEI
jgi:hypothetical protein